MKINLPVTEYYTEAHAAAMAARLNADDKSGDTYRLRQCERQGAAYWVIECWDREGFLLGDL